MAGANASVNAAEWVTSPAHHMDMIAGVKLARDSTTRKDGDNVNWQGVKFPMRVKTERTIAGHMSYEALAEVLNTDER